MKITVKPITESKRVLDKCRLTVCRGVLILPYKNGYLSTVCCDIANI